MNTAIGRSVPTPAKPVKPIRTRSWRRSSTGRTVIIATLLCVLCLAGIAMWRVYATTTSAAATADALRSASGCAQGRLVAEYLRRTAQAGLMLAHPAPLTKHDIAVAESACADVTSATLIVEQGAALGIQTVAAPGQAAAKTK